MNLLVLVLVLVVQQDQQWQNDVLGRRNKTKRHSEKNDTKYLSVRPSVDEYSSSDLLAFARIFLRDKPRTRTEKKEWCKAYLSVIHSC